MLPHFPARCYNYTPTDHSVYKLIMDIIGLIQFPFFIVSVFCILRKSPWSMGAYKWHILVFQLAIISFNIFLTILCTPILFYPFLCGYPDGLLTALEIPTRYQYLITTFTLSCVGASTICLFEHRHQCVLPTFHVLRHSVDYRVFKTTMYYLFAVFHVWLPVFVVDIEDKNLIEQVFDGWKDAPCDILNEMTVVLSPQKLGFLHFYYMGGIALVVILSFLYIAHSFYIIRATRILLSKDMQKIQRSFLKGLLLQVLIPYAALLIPAAVGLILLISTNNFNQKFVQIGLCLLSTHGLLSTVTTILVHQPYRNFLFFMCRRFFVPMGVKISTVDEFTTLPNLRKLGTHTHITKF